MSPEAAAQAAPPRPDPFGAQAALNAVLALHTQENRGALAELRRMDPEQPVEAAFLRILVKVWPGAGMERAKRLALFVKILALSAEAAPLTAPRRPLGELLADPAVDVKERRVQMLMTARGPALDEAVLRLARRLVRAGSLPVHQIARLLLGDEKTVERARFDIAKAYWGAAASPAETQSTFGDE